MGFPVVDVVRRYIAEIDGDEVRISWFQPTGRIEVDHYGHFIRQVVVGTVVKGEDRGIGETQWQSSQYVSFEAADYEAGESPVEALELRMKAIRREIQDARWQIEDAEGRLDLLRKAKRACRAKAKREDAETCAISARRRG